MMRIHSRIITDAIDKSDSGGSAEPILYYGVLFRFGDVSANRTVVKKGASVRAAGDSIWIEHSYPIASEFVSIGRVKSFYVKDNSLLVEFSLRRDVAQNFVESGEKKYLSVSWFSDDYNVKQEGGVSVIEFSDIVIYEISLVSSPAFNTCIATTEEGLSCLSPSVRDTKNQRRCCWTKQPSVSLYDMIAKHKDVTREEFEALRSEVTQIREALATIADEVKTLKDAVAGVPEEVVTEIEQARKKLEHLEMALTNQANDVNNVLSLVERLLSVTEKTYKNLPNLIKR